VAVSTLQKAGEPRPYRSTHHENLSLNSQLNLDLNIANMDPNAAISDQELQDYKNAFAVFDKDGDGVITAKELGEVMRSLGHAPTDLELQDVMNEVDKDGGGTIDLDEFLTMMKHKLSTSDTEAELLAAFQTFDRDNSGTISADELRAMLKSLGDEMTDQEINDLIREADTDGDNNISFAEFKSIMAL